VVSGTTLELCSETTSMNRFTVTNNLPASANTVNTVYEAWFDSDQHSEMMQSPATASTNISGIFTSHDEYIDGINLELDAGERIHQTWRTYQFEGADPDSSIELTFKTA
jgi:uncharacterized protein YndB with AHSA1/START domain